VVKARVGGVLPACGQSVLGFYGGGVDRPCLIRGGIFAWLRRAGCFFTDRERELKPEDGTLSGFTLDADPATLKLDNALADSQSQAGSAP